MTDYTIRSITYSVDINKILSKDYQLKVKKDIEVLKNKFDSNSVAIRTIRLNILPIKQDERLDKFLFLKKIETLSDFSKNIGIRWFNIAFDLIGLGNKEVKVICAIGYDIIKKYSTAFINFIVADDANVNTFAAKECAQMILNISRLSDNGFDNFRVGVSLNPRENTPFFPFSYGLIDNSFSLAVETSKPVIEALNTIPADASIDLKREVIIKELIPFVSKIDSLSKEVSDSLAINYGGQDISLAPFPDDDVSVIEILYKLGLDEIGSNGTLFFTSYLTGILKSVLADNNLKAAGFNGVMYSLLEDHLMCAANNKKHLSIDKIIGYSTLCGCGLDMVPIPGNILIEELASIILDVAVTAIKLKKPLGVRVLPIPNKDENEFTAFDMDFLTNTRVMKMKNMSLSSDVFHFNSFKV